MLSSDIVLGWCRQWVGRARVRWGRLTRNPNQMALGELDVVAGLLLEAYGQRRQRAEAEVDRLLADWQASRQSRG
jgi:uncharacterized protein YjbJ (UPF0337 family)